MENEMIERVARAIATNKRAPDQRTPEIIDKAWTAYCGQARAAIEAMREPIDAMKMPAVETFILVRTPFARAARDLSKEAGQPEGFHAGVAAMYPSGTSAELFAVYRAMIDAALAPVKQPA